MLLELFHGVAFQLANTLSRHAVAFRQFHQRRLVVAQPARFQDVAAAGVQGFKGDGELFGRGAGGIFGNDDVGWIGSGVFQVVRRGRRRVLGIVGAAVERHVARGQAAFHARDFGWRNAQIASDGASFRFFQPAEFLLVAAQIEEQLALRLRGGHLDDAPVAQDELVHLCLDPMHGEGDQTHANLRIEALDGFHQADVAFLDQVRLRQPVAGIAARQMDDEAQMAEHQLPGGV